MSRSKWFDKMTPDLTKSGQGRIQADAHRNIEERLEAVEDGVESISVPATPSSIGAASLTEPYVTISASSGLSAERVLTGTSNQITVTDGGANSTVTLSTPQNLHTAATFQVGRLGIGGVASAANTLTLFRADGTARISMIAHPSTVNHTLTWPQTLPIVDSVLNTDAAGVLTWYTRSFLASSTETYVTTASTSGLANERVLTGTANQITVTDNGAGVTVVLSTPQNLHTAATFQVGTLGIGGAAGGGFALDVVTGPSILRSTGAATPITAYGDGGLTSYGVEVYDTGTASTVAAMGLDGSVSCSSFVMGFPGVNTGTLQAPALSAARVYSMPDITGTVMLLQGTQTVSGAKTFTATCVFTGNSVLEVSSAADVRFRDGSDSSKLMFFDVSRFAASTNRVKGWTNNDGVVCDDGNVVCADGEVVTSGGEIVLAY